ncbi:MAG: ABC transporter ATP-binding protein [Planctomycetota bacterium]
MNRSTPDETQLSTLPAAVQAGLAVAWSPGESLVAQAELDLDGKQNFGRSFLVLSSQRLHFFNPQEPNGLKSWELTPELAMRTSLHAGLGAARLLAGANLVQTWNYTAAQATFVERLAVALNAVVKTRGNGTLEAGGTRSSTTCPSCGALLSADQPICLACAPSAAPPPAKSLVRLWRFAHRRRGMILFGFLVTLAATAAGLVPPYITMPLTDRVLIPWQNGEPVPFSDFYWYLGGLAFSALLAWALGWAKTYVMAKVSELISADLRNETYAHLQRLSLEFFGGKRTGDLISRIGSDTDRICNFLSIHLLDFASDILMITLTSIILLRIDPMLALVTLIPFPAIAWLIQRVRVKLRHGFARSSHAWGEMVSVMTDAIPGIRVVKAFAQERREIERFREANDHVLESNLRVNRLWAFFSPTVSLLTEIGILVIWTFGAWRVFQGQITVGVLTTFIAYISRFYVRLDSLSRMLANTQRAAAATYRIFEILDRQPSVMEPTRPIDPGRLAGRLELSGVRFKYGNREVIRGVDFTVEPGELVGLVGPSGSGKSTLVNLVCRFYDVTEGAILADGQDIRSFPIEKYRSNIGIVLQEPFLFYGTIAENIAYGRPTATRDEIIAAARAAHAHDFILRLPDGYDSLVGERGQSLSGGERQRISIARAILTNPRILILDEATSAVDNETERVIQAALDNLVQGRTTIAIAHRLSTLRNASRIIVMENGEVAEVGKHEDLLARGGVYTRLHQAQLVN